MMIGAFERLNAIEHYPNGPILAIIAGERATSPEQFLKTHAA